MRPRRPEPERVKHRPRLQGPLGGDDPQTPDLTAAKVPTEPHRMGAMGAMGGRSGSESHHSTPRHTDRSAAGNHRISVFYLRVLSQATLTACAVKAA